ncbi:MAG TPA: hypothetical protein PLV45_03825 [bacterium]|nr:hypothetical protein [bacterium]
MKFFQVGSVFCIGAFLVAGMCCFNSVSHAADIDLWLDMFDRELEPGDSFTLEIVTMNTGEALPEAAVCLLLEISGQFWCWPSWQTLETGFDYQILPIPEGRTKKWVFNSAWPDVPSAGIELYFWSAALDVNLTELLTPVYRLSWTY